MLYSKGKEIKGYVMYVVNVDGTVLSIGDLWLGVHDNETKLVIRDKDTVWEAEVFASDVPAKAMACVHKLLLGGYVSKQLKWLHENGYTGKPLHNYTIHYITDSVYVIKSNRNYTIYTELYTTNDLGVFKDFCKDSSIVKSVEEVLQ